MIVAFKQLLLRDFTTCYLGIIVKLSCGIVEIAYTSFNLFVVVSESYTIEFHYSATPIGHRRRVKALYPY